MKQLTLAMKSLTDETHQYAIALATMRTEMAALKENVDLLTKLFREGNSGGLLGRISLLEDRQDNIAGWVHAEKERQAKEAEAVRQARETLERLDRESHWKFITALVAGLTGVLAAAVAGLIALLRH